MADRKAKNGDAVSINYTGKLEDGTVFDSTPKGAPHQFLLGRGQVLAGVDEAVVGMIVGESKTVTIPPEKGFGLPKKDLTIEEDRAQLPSTIKKGETLQVTSADGKKFFATVTKLTKVKATLDLNNLLAGKKLVFEIELVRIT